MLKHFNHMRGEVLQKTMIKQSPLDEDFRRHTFELLSSAKKDIIIIAGEVGSFRFLDLRMAAKKAHERGVRIRIYANQPSVGIMNKLLKYGVELYLGGKKVSDHYLVVDGNSWIHSKEHPPGKIGLRKGYVYKNDPEGASKVIKLFKELIAKAKKIEAPKWDEDPLWLMLQNPLDWGVETDSSKFNEEFLRQLENSS